ASGLSGGKPGALRIEQGGRIMGNKLGHWLGSAWLSTSGRCCHAHDCCYQKLFDLGCHPYVDHYEHTIENNTSVICSELNETECDKQTCECDKSVVLCLRNQTYNEKHRNYLNIYCQGPTPNCSIYEPPPGEVACRHFSPAPPAPP
ncbi:group IIF secretory phospholipase A2-like, partial [Eumetopias jubatus]|uniref:group IIF secretory phospholipase A2-like n=1 Tax=Eumetopias jubatus TaxID=34886 RepID=UPI001015CBF0